MGIVWSAPHPAASTVCHRSSVNFVPQSAHTGRRASRSAFRRSAARHSCSLYSRSRASRSALARAVAASRRALPIASTAWPRSNPAPSSPSTARASTAGSTGSWSSAVDFIAQTDHFVDDKLRGAPDAPFIHDVARTAETDHQDIVLDAQAPADPAVRERMIRARHLPNGFSDMDTSLRLLFQAIPNQSAHPNRKCESARAGAR